MIKYIKLDDIVNMIEKKLEWETYDIVTDIEELSTISINREELLNEEKLTKEAIEVWEECPKIELEGCRKCKFKDICLVTPDDVMQGEAPIAFTKEEYIKEYIFKTIVIKEE